MQVLKVFGFLFFLVTSNLTFAISIAKDGSNQGDYAVDFQFNEEFQKDGVSTLSGPSFSLFTQPVFVFRVTDFVFRSIDTARKANHYIHCSATIKPGLDIQKLIFPFHTFL